MDIRIEKLKDGEYRVTVDEGGSRSAHIVRVDASCAAKLTGGRATAEELLRRSFEFLLEREPKESILARFDLPVIGRYFPEYEREIQRRLGK